MPTWKNACIYVHVYHPLYVYFSSLINNPWEYEQDIVGRFACCMNIFKKEPILFSLFRHLLISSAVMSTWLVSWTIFVFYFTSHTDCKLQTITLYWLNIRFIPRKHCFKAWEWQEGNWRAGSKRHLILVGLEGIYIAGYMVYRVFTISQYCVSYTITIL